MGFEPTVAFTTTVFKTVPLNRSGTPPQGTFEHKNASRSEIWTTQMLLKSVLLLKMLLKSMMLFAVAWVIIPFFGTCVIYRLMGRAEVLLLNATETCGLERGCGYLPVIPPLLCHRSSLHPAVIPLNPQTSGGDHSLLFHAFPAPGVIFGLGIPYGSIIPFSSLSAHPD